MKIEEHRIRGDCLAAIGIPSEGIAIIDRDESPRVFDVVWCNNTICAIGGYLKEIVQTGEKAIVHTRYEDPSRDYQFYAQEIYGVVLRVLNNDRHVVWERPPAIDVVPVVRCKDCKFYRFEQDEHFCLNQHGITDLRNPDNFCSNGEREEDK